MTRDSLERLGALAPQDTLDPAGLELARASLTRELVAHSGTRVRDVGRRARTLRRASLACAGALALVGAAVLLPSHDGGGGTAGQSVVATGILPAAAADDARCARDLMNEPVPAPVARDEWPTSPIGQIATLAGSGSPDTVEAIVYHRACPVVVPVAVVYGSDLAHGMNVFRDLAQTSMVDLSLESGAEDVRVRGTDARMLSWVNDDGRPRQRVSWRDADGLLWYAEAEDMEPAESLAVLDALDFDDEGVLDPRSVPEGLAAAAVGPPAIGAESSYRWVVEYGHYTVVDTDNGSYDAPEPGYRRLRVTTPVVMPVASRIASSLSMLVDFDGNVAAWSGLDGPISTLTWVDDGKEYQLSAAAGSLEEMLDIARTVQPVGTDDPRLQ